MTNTTKEPRRPSHEVAHGARTMPLRKVRQLQSRRSQLTVLSVLSVIVVLLVAVALHLRALAQTHEIRYLDCPVESGVGHSHDESCFDEEGSLICPLDEVELHYHDETCYDEQGNLLCGLEEGGDSHQHGPGCFRTVVVDDEGNVAEGGLEVVSEGSDGHLLVAGANAAEQTLEASGGETYDSARLDAPASAGVPRGSELHISELKDDAEGYDEYVAQAREAVGNDAAEVLLYDISIAHDDAEVQPQATVDVSLQLSEEVAGRFQDVGVLHFGADGPESLDASKDGTVVSFEAESFSVYAIVDAPAPYKVTAQTLQGLDELANAADEGKPLFLRLTVSNKYCSDSIITGQGCFVEGDAAVAADWYFEPTGTSNEYRIYTLDEDGGYHYIKNTTGNLLDLSESQNEAAVFTLSWGNSAYDPESFELKLKNANRYLTHSNGGGGIRLFDQRNENTCFAIEYAESHSYPDDPYELDGKSFAIGYRQGTTMAAGLGDALSGAKLQAQQLTVRPNITGDDGYRYASGDDDLAEWTFESVDKNHYYIRTSEGKYLTVTDGVITLEDDPQPGSVITVEPGSGTYAGSYRLSVGAYAIDYESSSKAFRATTNSKETNYLNFFLKDSLSDDDYVKYRARKVNLSDREKVPSGSKVVIYTRIWSDRKSKYEFFIVGHDGSLRPVYESGDVIQWIGGSINTALWDFTEYVDDDGNPTYYYDLRNTYSGNYLAPQLDGQVVQDSPIGLNLNGRRYGEDHTTIVAWDDPYYDYASLRASSDSANVEACPLPQADDFYFAIFDETFDPENEEFTEVATVDNNEHGITMKMIDYNNGHTKKSNRDDGQVDVLGLCGTTQHLPEMLLPYLNDDGYPSIDDKITKTDTGGHSLSELYADYAGQGTQLTDVNHLFLQGTYDESGYFEYDSTQNFAHLNQPGEDNEGDFTVYDQIAAVDTDSGPTRTHGQFLPYNMMTKGKFASYRNLTDVSANPLSDIDPRKGEQLYFITAKEADYFFGMELEASFIQTPSGLDAWGHDIIFEFSGDDDFWLYVDGFLVLDLGGVRSALSGSVNFKTGTTVNAGKGGTLYAAFKKGYAAKMGLAEDDPQVQAYLNETFTTNGDGQLVFRDYTTHTMKMFYMERGAGASNLHMRFNLASAKPNTVVLKKQISGTEKSDYALAEFPYQVYYKTSNDEGAPYQLLTGTYERDYVQVPTVTYSDRSEPVKYAASYTPTGGTESYEHVFFLKPGQSADIRLPDDCKGYYIKECAVNTKIYNGVSANGEPLGGVATGNENRSDYAIAETTLADTPRVTYDNHVNPSALRTLSITKRLYDAGGAEIFDDPTGFTMRLSVAGEGEEEPELANMYPYSVKDPDGCYCTWNRNNQSFEPIAGKTTWSQLTDEEKSAAVFYTSIYGSISKIPARYTIEVRDLLVGTKFMVEEYERDIPSGYAFKGYARVGGTYIAGESDNSGIIRDNSDPAIEVHNRRGWGLTAEKAWSDKDYMSAHDPIYFAVYIDGELDEESVRQLANGKTTSYWFYKDLEAGKSFEDYEVREVTLGGSFDAAQDVGDTGAVKLHDGVDVTPIDNNGSLSVGATPTGGASGRYTYDVTYEKGEATGAVAGVENVRTDVVRNTRDGIKIYKQDYSGQALAGATFALTHEDGTPVGAASYTSDDEGFVTNAYLPDGNYLLTETAAPTGYHALEDSLSIGVTDGVVTLGGDDAVMALCSYDQDAKQITVRDKGFQLQMVKKGAGDAVLPDAHFALYRQVTDASGDVRPDYNPMAGYEDLVTDENGAIPQIDVTLASGTYYLRETQAPEGYALLDGDLCFEMAKTGAVVLEADPVWSLAVDSTTDPNVVSYNVSILNELSSQKVELHKVDEAGGDLAGATFELLMWEGAGAPDSAGGAWVTVQDDIRPGDAATSTANPVMLGTDPMGLAVGSYRLHEVGSPDGYVILDGKTDFSVVYDDQAGKLVVTLASDTDASITCEPRDEQDGTVVYTITVPNTPGAELPHAGGAGATAFYAIGAVLTAAGALHLARRARVLG